MMPNRGFSQLTPKQLEVFRAIRNYMAHHHQPPTLKELAKDIGASSLRSVTQYLQALERKGVIARSHYQSRSIRLLEGPAIRSETITLPVVGNAGCDNLSIYADENVGEYITLDREFLRGYDPKQTVVIRAMGSSMIDAGIKNGDLVLTELTPNVEDGEKIVAIIDNTAVIKRVSFTDDAVILSPMSPDPQYRPIIMKEDFTVSGRVIDVIRSAQSKPEYVYDE